MGWWMDHWEVDDDDPYYGDEVAVGRFRLPTRTLPDFSIFGEWTGVSTAKAVLWRLLDGREQWFPRSQIHKQEPDHLVITGWLAQQKGLGAQDNIAPLPPEPPLPDSAEDYGFSGCEQIE